jgi:diguanylate cyclase (GGDEF)-like protein/PAS domain S-box-containing protein
MVPSLTLTTDVFLSNVAEECLRLVKAMFEHSDEAILITDAEARILTINPAFSRASGYALEEVRGKNPRIFSSGRHDKVFYREMWESMQRLGTWSGEIWDRHKDGHVYPKWMKVLVIQDEDQEVAYYLAISTDISARKEAEENIRHLAYYDILTGLPNRTLLHDRINQQLAAAHRDQQTFALLFIDLDRFKYINDSMGHAMGDQLLQSVANRIVNVVREGDTVSRIGGDEFVILLREADADGAAHVAQSILNILQKNPHEVASMRITVQASIGISLYPENGHDIGTLIKHADVAMYRAKEEGRNNFKFFTPEMNSRINLLFSMEKDLRLALERGEFHLHFQPQMDMSSGMLCGAEALIRWRHPEKGMISPVDFIPIAEETGQINAIGEWVLQTVCGKIAAWREQGLCPFPVAVNLSLHQLLQPDLAQLITSIVREHALDPDLLELEVTESILLSDAQIALDFLTSMRELGVRLSIDDFGTGYSSLSYLKKMPVNKLKIDRSFINDILTDQSDEAIVRSIIALGHHFKLSVIAEGIEESQQLDFLRSLGCDEMQGYYFARPLPENEFVEFVRTRFCEHAQSVREGEFR